MKWAATLEAEQEVPLGPFDIDAERIVGLGARFTAFVTRLIELEASAHGLRGSQLVFNPRETTPDGGVDASTREAAATDFIPTGNTAWQFKRSNLGPTACADEFENAHWAREFVREGGSYVLLLGVPLNDNLIENRRKKIAERAIELGLLTSDDRSRVRVYDAAHLARWASRFPSLAVSQLAVGPGSVAVDFERWESGRGSGGTWVADDARSAAIQSIREQVSSNRVVEVRVQGESGIGKTRLVLEALRDDSLRPLVAYVADERSVDGELLAHLIEEGRTAILVVDECPADRHAKLAERLPDDPAIKLVTIGDAGAAAVRTPTVGLAAMPSDQVEEFLRLNYPQLGAEARRFVTDHSQGNMRWTIVLADRVVGAGYAQAADLIARNDIEEFVAALLPEGRGFFCAAVLALFERVGWDRDRRGQLEMLADFAHVSVDDMEDVERELELQGLITRQGRYRAIGPRPLSVFLAAEAWRLLGARIIEELLPLLDEEMALGLFERVAELGQFEPARSVLPRLLASDGPFSSLERIESTGIGRQLTQLAIILPEDVTLHLAELIESASLGELRGQSEGRRDLVWTLEKLVWHTRTFEAAARCLLRLALAENETWANNATGTWIDLFGTMLPGTAALPEQRLRELARVAEDADATVRMLAVKAADHALDIHSSITVSGEIQGGVLVEPRGIPRTWGDVGAYRRSVIALLDQLRHDVDAEVAQAAEDALLDALHPLIDDPFAGDALSDVLVALTGAALERLRTSCERILGLYERHEPPEDRNVVEKVQALLERLPAPTSIENLRVASQLRGWDFEGTELQARMRASFEAVRDDGRVDEALGLLSNELPAAWEFGRALGLTLGKSETLDNALLAAADVNGAALVGYLSALAEADEAAFDDFLEAPGAANLTNYARVAIAVRGPATERARHLIFQGLRELSVSEGTVVLFGWQRNLTEEDLAVLIQDWLMRIESQADYNRLVDWVNLALYEGIPESLRNRVFDVLMRRAELPDLGNEKWDWCHLAEPLIADRGLELAESLLALMESGASMIHSSDEEARLLSEVARSHPEAFWNLLTPRLDSWRVSMQIRGWLLLAVPTELIENWVGGDVARARLVAAVSPLGGAQPTDVARFLLATFGADEEVSSSLWGEMVSGSWTGPESDRIARQINQLNGWRGDTTEPVAVRNWARDMVGYLEQSRQAALEREAERGF